MNKEEIKREFEEKFTEINNTSGNRLVSNYVNSQVLWDFIEQAIETSRIGAVEGLLLRIGVDIPNHFKGMDMEQLSGVAEWLIEQAEKFKTRGFK